MNKATFWVILGVLTAFAVGGVFVLFEPPALSNTNASDFEQFYRSQYVLAVVIGLMTGALLGWLATRRTYHEPRERGSDFTGKVNLRGIFTGLAAAILTAAVVLVYASQYEIQPLAPLEKVAAVASNGLFYVVLTIATVTAMLTYAIATRMPRWGGQYALIKRF